MHITKSSIIFGTIATLLVLLASSITTHYALLKMKNDVLEEKGKTLDVVLESTHSTLMLWLKQQQNTLLQTAEIGSVYQRSSSLLQLLNKNSTDLTAISLFKTQLFEELTFIQEIQNNQGFVILDRQGNVVESTFDIKSRSLQLNRDYPTIFARAADNKFSFFPPVVYQSSDNSTVLAIFILTPITVGNVVLGYIGSKHLAQNEITNIAALGRIGETGETYLFNENGMMTSETRFIPMLIKAKLLAKNQTAILNVILKDPGVNLIDATHQRKATPSEFTLMAKDAIAKNSSKNLSGYRDYRGVLVIGAWRWVPELNMGVTTEIDLKESLESYYSARKIIISLLAISLTIAFTLATIVLLISYKSNALLQKLASRLESDVNERTRQLSNAVNDLGKERVLLQSLFDNIPDPIFCKDNNKKYVRANDAFFTLSQSKPEDIIGKTDAQIFSCESSERALEIDDIIIETGKPFIEEQSGFLNTISDKLFETRKSILTFNTGQAPGILGISRDITEQRESENALIKATQAAKLANIAKSEFLASMSHEIRTPMNGVIGMIDLVIDTQLSEEQTSKLLVARSSANNLLTIINDILDFSRVEAGKLSLESIDFNLRKQIEESVKALALKAEEKGIELLIDVTQLERAMVKGDPVRINQVLTNLLNNAIKFTEQGQVIVKINTKPIDSRNIELQCAVEDTGIGIPSEKLDSLFDSFTQVDSSTTRIYGGSGLGLSICERLCTLMNGSITATSVEGKGSCFTFTVVLERSDLHEKILPIINVEDWNVLIVDDNQTNRSILTSQLNSWRINVVSADSADAALAILRSRKYEFNLIITDMHMPRKDGLTFVLEVKQIPHYCHVKILMLSSMSFDSDKNQLKRLGLDGCLIKPVAMSDLYNAIRIVANQHGDEELNISALNNSMLRRFDEDNSRTIISEWPPYHRILIVEDNAINRLVAEGLLTKLKLRFDVAVHGQDAIDKMIDSHGNDTYTLLLMDCQMPIMDGYKATQQIRSGVAGEQYSNIPIVAMTANALKGDKEKCIAVGMNDYVPKPINAAQLEKALLTSFAKTPSELCKFNMPNVEVAEADDSQLTIPSNLTTMDWTLHPPNLCSQGKIYLKSVSLFIKQYSELHYQYPTLKNESKAFEHDIHTLKGSSGNLGFHKLFETTMLTENKLLEGRLVPGDIARLNTVIEYAIDDAYKLLEHNKAGKVEHSDLRSISEIFDEILPLVERSELVPFDTIEELNRHLEEQKNVQDESELRDIVELLEVFDYDKVRALLKNKK